MIWHQVKNLWTELNNRFLDALYVAVDGNFTNNQKEKNTDENDVPLTMGGAYFANEKAFEAYSKTLGDNGTEVCESERHSAKRILTYSGQPSTCHQFGAMGHGYTAKKVTGVVGVFCARHMFAVPGGSVDLQKGER